MLELTLKLTRLLLGTAFYTQVGCKSRHKSLHQWTSHHSERNSPSIWHQIIRVNRGKPGTLFTCDKFHSNIAFVSKTLSCFVKLFSFSDCVSEPALSSQWSHCLGRQKQAECLGQTEIPLLDRHIYLEICSPSALSNWYSTHAEITVKILVITRNFEERSWHLLPFSQNQSHWIY